MKANFEKTKHRPYLIWDLALRLFHIALIVTVAILLLTGFFGNADTRPIHGYAGYGLVCLLFFRLLWGFIGGFYSRFQTWHLSLKEGINYLKLLFQAKASSYAGHNPAGSWMVVALLGLLFLLCLSGTILWAGIEMGGPLRHWIGFNTSHSFKAWHEYLAWALVISVTLHIVAVLYENFYLKHRLIMSMITGYKIIDEERIKQSDVLSNSQIIQRGLIGFAGIGLLIGLINWHLGSLPARGWYDVTKDQHFQDYRLACGECHMAYHPSLHSEDSWQILMNNLDSHFGEDASLALAKKEAILAWLAKNNASHFDTKLSAWFGLAKNSQDTAGDNRITDLQIWKRLHKDLPTELFKRSSIRSSSNCLACHQDAESGLFLGGAIHIPN